MIKTKEKLNIILALMIALLLTGCSEKHSQSTPEKTVAYAIYLLENKKYDELIDNMVDPTYLKRRPKNKIDQIKRYFKTSKKPGRMLKQLIAAQKSTKIQISDSVVKYNLTGKNISLIKINGKWYIKN